MISNTDNHNRLVLYSLVETFYNRNKSLINIVPPLALECLKRMNESSVFYSDLKDRFQEYFGIEIPYIVLQTAYKYTDLNKYISIDQNVVNVDRYINDDLQFKKVYNKSKISLDHLLDDIVKYSLSIYKSFQPDRKLLIDSLLDILIIDVYDDFSNSTGIHNIEDIEPNNYYKLIIAKYITYITSNYDTEHQGMMLEVLQGYLYSRLLEESSLVEMIRNKSNNIISSVIIDTPIIIGALGCSNKAFNESIKQSMVFLSANKIYVYYYEHNIQEAISILKSCKRYINDPSLTIYTHHFADTVTFLTINHIRSSLSTIQSLTLSPYLRT